MILECDEIDLKWLEKKNLLDLPVAEKLQDIMVAENFGWSLEYVDRMDNTTYMTCIKYILKHGTSKKDEKRLQRGY
jgi:hypothetical protein